ncbi:MAG: class I SAM-dependent methyltransferase [Clostridiales bacterium]|nr:class I SAM-dependent methyltransferase [Clostridiales bacterium]
MNPLQNFYETHDEHMRFSSKSGQVEFLTTVRYAEKYLFPDAKILEIGAGSGRYSHHFAQKGYEVDAVELLDVNIEKIHAQIEESENLRVFKGNALDLSFLENENYDIVLLLGPLYHLYTEKDQLTALYEALRLLKKGGVLMNAYCLADAAILMAGFKKGLTKSLIERKLLDPVTFKTHSEPEDVFQLFTVSDIDRLNAQLPAKRLHLVGSDMSAEFLKDTIDQMDDETFEIYLNYHFTVCERNDLIGAGNHALDILRKE